MASRFLDMVNLQSNCLDGGFGDDLKPGSREQFGASKKQSRTYK
jgi:hypothetical protein